MSIRMHRYENGRDGLAAFCDTCGEQILEHGYVVWNSNDPADWRVVHQARCDPGRKGGYDYSMDFACEIVYLANSAKVDLEDAWERMAMLESIG